MTYEKDLQEDNDNVIINDYHEDDANTQNDDDKGGLTWPRGKGPQAASQLNTQVLTPTLHTSHTLHILHFSANCTKGSPPCAHSSQLTQFKIQWRWLRTVLCGQICHG